METCGFSDRCPSTTRTRPPMPREREVATKLVLMCPARAKQTDKTRGFMAHQNSPKPTKAERTAAAREKARQMREAQRSGKSASLLVKGGVVVAVLVIIGVIAAVVMTNQRGQIADAGGRRRTATPSAVTPLRERAGGDRGRPRGCGERPRTRRHQRRRHCAGRRSAAPKGKPANIVMYVDMGCPVCKSFEGQYGGYLTSSPPPATQPSSTGWPPSSTGCRPRTTRPVLPTPWPGCRFQAGGLQRLPDAAVRPAADRRWRRSGQRHPDQHRRNRRRHRLSSCLTTANSPGPSS